MTEFNNLEKLVRVPITHEFPIEPSDFSPWLALQENLNELGSALGIEIEYVDKAVKLPDSLYEVDILCQDPLTSDKIIIENQYKKTNHDHMGKIITYTAGFDAKTVIWIAEEIRDEHITSIEWLNDNMKQINFFLVKFELYKIDNSRSAPLYLVISKPNQYIRDIQNIEEQRPLTDGQKLHFDYRNQFQEYCGEKNGWKLKSDQRRVRYFSFKGDKSMRDLGITVKPLENLIDIYYWFTEIDVTKPKINYLSTHKEEIEKKLGKNLHWDDHLENKRKKNSSSITLSTDKFILTDKSKWVDSMDWIIDNIEILRDIFAPYIKNFEDTIK